MQHDEIKRMITGSSPGDWVLLGEGPLFIDGLTEVSAGDRHWLEVDRHNYLAVYKPDVDLRLAWGLTLDTGLSYDGWVFPDPAIDRLLVDGFWQGSLVARWTLVSVDGHRCYLPDPERAYVKTGDSPRDYETVGWTATKTDIALARLLNELVQRPAGEFERYMSQSGIVEISDR
jgi:hypothetical protein